MSILRHADFDTEERDAYLRVASARRREGGEEAAENEVALSEERIQELAAGEQFILTIADSGYGKRSSAYEYRITRRGGKGIVLMKLGAADHRVVAAFPVVEGDQIMLVTDGGKLIRCPVDDIRIAGRSTRGVTLFRVAEDERVVSVARLVDVGENNAAGDDETGQGDTDEAGASADAGEGSDA